ncbi:FmdB family zinc ribbon protein [Syntrophobacter fumaroxidans]|nr:zinc ribbon domain-containing protein [Syntrophobacter fumaroxidans]
MEGDAAGRAAERKSADERCRSSRSNAGHSCLALGGAVHSSFVTLLEGEMPIFEYQCCKCGEEFETLVFRSDEPVSCPKCDCAEVRKMMSVCGFKSGGDKGAAGSRMGTGASSCAGCAGGSCSTCH